MKFKKTILTAIFASLFFIGTSVQASPACDQALNDLNDAIVSYQLNPSKLGISMIASADAEVTLQCTASVVGVN